MVTGLAVAIPVARFLIALERECVIEPGERHIAAPGRAIGLQPLVANPSAASRAWSSSVTSPKPECRMKLPY